VSARSLERVGRELRDKLATIVEQRVSDPRLRGVSIVEVRPSPDLSYARVFYRTLGDPREAERALRKAKPFLRRCLAENLRLRRVPELDLRHDPSVESAERIEHLLAEIEAERERRASEARSEPSEAGPRQAALAPGPTRHEQAQAEEER
jgi:ribosome-binding factor A